MKPVHAVIALCITPTPLWQPLYDRLPGSQVLTGELTGRRLLAVWALRQTDQQYACDADADSYWLQLEGDDPSHNVWLCTDWVVDFFDKTWRLLPRAVVAPVIPQPQGSAGLRPLPEDLWLQPPHAVHLSGLVLSDLQVAHGYETHVAALTLRFLAQPSATTSPARSAILLFDWGQGPEECDTTAMMVSDDPHVGRWPVSGALQKQLDSPPRHWSQPWSRPPQPWDDEVHWHALVASRQQWQAWLADHADRMYGCLPLAARVHMLTPLFRLLHGLVALEVRLGRHPTPPTETAWPTYPSLVDDLRASLHAAWPWVAPGGYKLAWQRIGLNLNDAAAQRSANGLKPVWTTHQIWSPLFRALTHLKGRT